MDGLSIEPNSGIRSTILVQDGNIWWKILLSGTERCADIPAGRNTSIEGKACG
jgi:hypothetical protein